MKTSELIKEIKRLPIQKRIYVIEKAIHSIRQQEDAHQIEKAVNDLYSEYKTNSELTAFSNIDFEDFYETK